MMDVDVLLKDCGEAYGRLFDHRPVIRGEINFFVREFEDKRGHREEIRLQKAMELTVESRDKLLPMAIEKLCTSFSDINQTLHEATSVCNEILHTESFISAQSQWLEDRRAERSKEWTAYVEMMCERCRAIDDEFAGEVKRVENYYSELEDKLNLKRSTPQPAKIT